MHRLRVLPSVPTSCGRWSNLIQELEVTHGTRGHGTRSVRAKTAATPYLPVPLSETACNACIWPRLSGTKLLASPLRPVKSFRVPSNLQPVHTKKFVIKRAACNG